MIADGLLLKLFLQMNIGKPHDIWNLKLYFILVEKLVHGFVAFKEGINTPYSDFVYHIIALPRFSETFFIIFDYIHRNWWNFVVFSFVLNILIYITQNLSLKGACSMLEILFSFSIISTFFNKVDHNFVIMTDDHTCVMKGCNERFEILFSFSRAHHIK